MPAFQFNQRKATGVIRLELETRNNLFVLRPPGSAFHRLETILMGVIL